MKRKKRNMHKKKIIIATKANENTYFKVFQNFTSTQKETFSYLMTVDLKISFSLV